MGLTLVMGLGLILVLMLAGVHVGMCARILGVFPIMSVSHQVVYRAVMTELAQRGHQLVVITPNPVNDPSLVNYTEIDVSFLYDDLRKTFDFALKRQSDESRFSMTISHVSYGERMCKQVLDHEPVKKLISPNNTEDHFDLVILEWFNMPAMYGFARRFSAPMVGMISLPLFGYNHDSVGNPTNPAYIPETYLPYSDKMTFFERLDTFVYSVRLRHFFFNTVIPIHQAIADHHFGPFSPDLQKMHYNVSMLFVNYEPSFHPPRPEVPAVVHMAGLHLKPPKPLPQDLQKYMDSAPKGVVYFSLGSNVRSDRLDERTRQMFLDAFSELEGYLVLWKWESDSLPGQPANVMVRKWLPQQDILRHPKVKAFITQGGLQSVEEAIHSGVPLISIPFIADQDYNSKRIVEKGIGLTLDINNISKDKIVRTVRAIFDDKSFQNNARRLSTIMRDQPTSPLERAVWWLEYVLRHKGAAHLRTAAVDMPWHQYLLLDILAFLIGSVLAAVLLLWKVATFLYRKLLSHSSRKLKVN